MRIVAGDAPEGENVAPGTPKASTVKGFRPDDFPTISRPTCRDGRPLGPARPDEMARFQIQNRPLAAPGRRAPTKLRGFESRMRHQN